MFTLGRKSFAWLLIACSSDALTVKQMNGIELDIQEYETDFSYTFNKYGLEVFPQRETGVAHVVGNKIRTGCGVFKIKDVPSDKFGNLQLAYHNQVRAANGAKLLKWDADLAADAQAYAEKLAENNAGLVYAKGKGKGENLYYASSKDGSHRDKITNTDAASRSWYEGYGQFRFPYDGSVPSELQDYSQMIWSETCGLGCGQAAEYVVCRYSPEIQLR